MDLLYNIVLFVHILGAILMFIAVGITLTAMISMLHSKSTEHLRMWAALAVKMDGLLPLSVIFILIPGLYLVFTTWGWSVAWMNLSLLALVIMTFMGPIINLKRLKGILHVANEETESMPTSKLLDRVQDRVLWNSVSIMSMLVIGILFLMTVKLSLIGSLITIIIAIILGPVVANLLLKGVTNASDQNKGKETPTQF